MHFRILKTTAISGFLAAPECTKFIFGWGSAPDPTGEAHDAPPDPIIGWRGVYLSPSRTQLGTSVPLLSAFGTHHSAPRFLGGIAPSTSAASSDY